MTRLSPSSLSKKSPVLRWFSSVLLLAAISSFLFSGCVSVALGGKRPIDDGSVQGTLYLPRLYQPLMTGSTYPNRRMPVAAQNQPAVVVVPPIEASPATDRVILELTTRGMVVFLLKRDGGGGAPDVGHVDGAVRLLAQIAETRGAPAGVLLFHPNPDFAAFVLDVNRVSAVVILGLEAVGPAPKNASDILPTSASKAPVLVSNVSGAGLPSAEITESFRWMLGRKPVEKWYGADPKIPGVLPAEAFRDAAEWLAHELEIR